MSPEDPRSPEPPSDAGPSGDELLALAYEELKRVAAAHLRHERSDHTLAPTALVHEAWLRLGSEPRERFRDVGHFCAFASNVMRRVLVDRARRRQASKRDSGGERITLHEDQIVDGPADIDVLALDEALAELAKLHARQARVVELRYFGGLTLEEVASVLEVARSVAAEDWRMARAFLSWRLSERP